MGVSEADVRAMLRGEKGAESLTPEARKLMEQIMADPAAKEHMAKKVGALINGSQDGSQNGGVGGADDYPSVGVEGTNLSEARAWDAELEEVGGLEVQAQKGGYSITDRVRMRDKKSAMVGARGSVKRQSEIQREKKQSRQEEREEERVRKQSYYRKVTGLRKAKVPMMVYSCGGFSRCFRVCKFYDVEGPPVGVEYDPAPGVPANATRNL